MYKLKGFYAKPGTVKNWRPGDECGKVYNNAGQLVSEHEGNNSKYYAYDDLGRLERIASSCGGYSEYKYHGDSLNVAHAYMGNAINEKVFLDCSYSQDGIPLNADTAVYEKIIPLEEVI